ncbi:MAG TPA: ATP-binding protein [Planctomycetota bacterium]|nr:ATP-binding protein [Planctomycetota bacterium]
MRRRRYALLGALALLALLGVAWSARSQFRALARTRAEGLRDQLAAELLACAEHARYLARRAPGEIPSYLTYFRGLARVRLFDADGRPTHHFERHPYQKDADLVAALPPGMLTGGPADAPHRMPGGVARTDFLVDARREELDPARRHVIRFVAPREGGGAIELTVLADPYLAPLRAAGAVLRGANGEILLQGAGGDGRAEGAGWSIETPAAGGPVGLYAALGGSIVLLALAAVLVSERQLRAQERALVAQRFAQQDRLSALGLLSAGIAHEINNPLEGTLNWLAVGDAGRAREGLERIRAIAKDLLSFARRDPGDGPADVKACVARALDLARYAQVFRAVEVEDRVPPALLVAAPPRLLEQVLLNLLLNAGAVMKDPRRVSLDAARNAASVRIEVADTGPGIAAEDLPRLFDPFFTRTGGTGLGLCVSHGMVLACGGDLRAANAPGGGAVFTVELPAS